MTDPIKKESNGHGGRRPGAGRPPGTLDRATKAQKGTLEELARQYTQTALDVLIEVARNGESESARVTAANSLLDRAYGRARQSIEYVQLDPATLDKLTDEQLQAKAQETVRRLRIA